MKELGIHHFYHFTVADRGAVGSVWTALTDALGLAEKTSETTEIPRKAWSAGDRPQRLRHLEGKRGGLSLTWWAHSAAVVLSLKERRAEQGWDALVVQLEECRTSVSGDADDAYGQSTVFVGSSKDLPTLKLGLLASHGSPLACDSHFGTFSYFSAGKDEQSQEWTFEPAKGQSPEVQSDALQLWLPPVTGSMHRLKKIGDHVSENRDRVEAARKEADGDTGRVLHRAGSAAGAGSVEDLEKKIEVLSDTYGRLASDLMVLSKNRNVIEDEASRFQRALDSLVRGGDDGFAAKGVDEARAATGRGGKEGQGDSLRRFVARRSQEHFTELEREADLSRSSLSSVEAAIGVVRTQAELLRSRETAISQEQTKTLLDQNVHLQKEGVALQAAAGFIEFVIVYYYSLHSWAILAGEELFARLPTGLVAGLVLFFAATALVGTHFIARVLATRRWLHPGLVVSAVLLLGALAAMYFLTVSAHIAG